MLNLKKKLLLGSLVLCLSFMVWSGVTALMIEYDLNQLVKESSDIIIGKVTDKKSEWNENKTKIFTEVTINVNEAVKGDAAGTIKIKFKGGQVTNPDGTGVGMGVSDTPKFDINEEVFVFLQNEKDAKIFKVTANYQGKFSITKDEKTGEKIIKSVAKTLVNPETNKTKDVEEFSVPLKDFSAKVKEIADKEKTK